MTPTTTSPAFEVIAKRRKGYPSETRVKRGFRVVHGDKELVEKLGRNDPCPCGSGSSFQALLSQLGPVSTAPGGTITGAIDTGAIEDIPARATARTGDVTARAAARP